MAAELSRKVLELSGMEELITDLKAQNETLLKKVRKCGLEHEDNKYDRRESEQGSLALQDLTDFEVARWVQVDEEEAREAQENSIMYSTTNSSRGRS